MCKIFVLEFEPFFMEYSKSNELLFIEAILNSLVDHYGNSFGVEIYTPWNELHTPEKIVFTCVFTFKTDLYIDDFIINSYRFKKSLDEFITSITYIGKYSGNEKTSYSSVKYKLDVKNGDYVDKVRIDLQKNTTMYF